MFIRVRTGFRPRQPTRADISCSGSAGASSVVGRLARILCTGSAGAVFNPSARIICSGSTAAGWLPRAQIYCNGSAGASPASTGGLYPNGYLYRERIVLPKERLGGSDIVDYILRESTVDPDLSTQSNGNPLDGGVDVRSYSAACNGTTDDTTAFTNALRENAIVNMPAGLTSRIDNLHIPSNRTLQGAGPGATLKLPDNKTYEHVVLRVENVHNVEIRNLTVHGNKQWYVDHGLQDVQGSGAPPENGGMHCIRLTNCDTVAINFVNAINAWTDGFWTGDAVTNVTCDNFICDGGRRQGWTMNSRASDLNFFDCQFINTLGRAPGAGIDFESPGGDNVSRVNFYGCKFNNNHGRGIVFDWNGKTVDGVNFINCEFLNNGSDSVALVGRPDGSGPTTFSNFRFAGCNLDGDFQYGAASSAPPTGSVVLTNIIVEENHLAGIVRQNYSGPPPTFRNNGTRVIQNVPSRGKVRSANGYDIRYELADGITKLDHDVLIWNGDDGTIEHRIRIPLASASSDTVLFRYFGNPLITSPEANPAGCYQNLLATWDQDGKDLTGQGRNLTPHGGLGSIGLFGPHWDLNGTSQYLDIANATWADGLAAFCMQAWYSSDTVGNDAAVLSTGPDGAADDNACGMIMRFEDPGQVSGVARSIVGKVFISGTGKRLEAVTGSQSTGIILQHVQWQSSQKPVMYLNGAPAALALDATAATGTTATRGKLRIGRHPFAGGFIYWAGRIGEVRLLGRMLLANDIALQNLNYRTPDLVLGRGATDIATDPADSAVAIPFIVTVPTAGSVDIDVLGRAINPDGSALAITALGVPSLGTATIVGGKIRYTPQAGAPPGQVVEFDYGVITGVKTSMSRIRAVVT